MSSLYNIDYLKHLCQKYGLIPSKKYGQNFLINAEPIAKMLEAADLKTDDTVVEVGPGFGVLTLALAEKAKKVMVFEIEKKLMPYWEKTLFCHSEHIRFAQCKLREESLSQVERTEILRSAQDDKRKCRYKNIEIIWGNVLNTPPFIPPLKGEGRGLPPSLGEAERAGVGFKVVANLPYQITSNAIRKFLEAEHKPELMVLMAQKEVAERICAKAGEMSVLSVSVQYYAEPKIIMYVPKSYFWPAPAVDSAIIKIRSKVWGVGSSEFDHNFFKVVKAGFASRRKMLIKNLGLVADKKKLIAIFKELGINEKARAQELSVEQWRALVRRME